MKKSLLYVCSFIASINLNAQTQNVGTPISWKSKVGVAATPIKMTSVNNLTETNTELARRAATFEKNLNFGKELSVDLDVMNLAQVTVLPNGKVLRQLVIESKDALSINVIFSEFELAKSAVLYLFDGEQTEYIGAHTALNNNVNKIMGTDLIHDDKIVIELVESSEEAGTSHLKIGTVVHGFLDLEEELKALNSSGTCNYDVNCPIGAGWENQRNATGMMVNGGGFCTGSLVNNTTGTIIPYFLSANHCGTSPASWVFRFRWERPSGQTVCVGTGTAVNGPEDKNINGGILRANYATSDVTLTELNSAPDPAWGIYYNGWNRSNIPASSAVGVHHPDGDIMKISFENTPLISTTFAGTPDTHWGVTSWDNGVTEPGSSGSPLFDENHRTVGQLHGGASVCGGANLSDEYGKFFLSWTGGGTNSSRLSNWLDPSGTAGLTIDGVDPAGPGIPLDGGLSAVSGTTGTICGTTVTPTVTISNAGSDVLTSATITYGYDANNTLVYNWTGSLNQFGTEVINLPSATLTNGAHSFNATISNPNGSADVNTGNNVQSSTFSIIANPINVNLDMVLDCYGNEITWQIKDQAGTTTLFSGGPYDETTTGGEIVDETFCLAAACYQFVIEDSYGDGLASTGCPVPAGNYQLTEDDGTILAEITAANANFGDSNTQPFCLTSNIGVSETLDAMWVAYPNPATDKLNVNFGTLEGQKVIEIKNAAGAIVQTISTLEQDVTVELNQLSAGMYFVQLFNGTVSTTKKITIK